MIVTHICKALNAFSPFHGKKFFKEKTETQLRL